MSSPQEMVRDWALAEVGYVPSTGKYNKYAEYLDRTDLYNGPKNGYDWCDVFADCDYVSNFGIDVATRMIAQPLHGCGAGCAWSASYYRAADQWDGDPSIGAQIFFGLRGSESHTGIVVGYSSGYVHTVEGNTGYSNGYLGGAVLKRTYARNDSRIVGYGVPDWSLAGGNPLVLPKSNALEHNGELEVDGYLGVQSVTSWQRALGTTVDGFVSSQSWEDWGATPRLVAVEREMFATGSELVRRVQHVVGAEEDGLMGSQTVRCLQVWLDDHGFACGPVDGVLGVLTAKAAQRALNAGAWS